MAGGAASAGSGPIRAALDRCDHARRLVQDSALRTPDGHFMWFALKARPVVGSDGEVSRVSELTDVTEIKNAEERRCTIPVTTTSPACRTRKTVRGPPRRGRQFSP